MRVARLAWSLQVALWRMRDITALTIGSTESAGSVKQPLSVTNSIVFRVLSTITRQVLHSRKMLLKMGSEVRTGGVVDVVPEFGQEVSAAKHLFCPGE